MFTKLGGKDLGLKLKYSKQVQMVINHYIDNTDTPIIKKNINVNIDDDPGILIRLCPLVLFFYDSYPAIKKAVNAFSSFFCNHIIYHNICDLFALFFYKLLSGTYERKKDLLKFKWSPKAVDEEDKDTLISFFSPLFDPEEYKENEIDFIDQKTQEKEMSPVTVMFNSLWIFFKFDTYIEGAKYIWKKKKEGYNMVHIGGLYSIIASYYYNKEMHLLVKKRLNNEQIISLDKLCVGLCKSRDIFWNDMMDK